MCSCLVWVSSLLHCLHLFTFPTRSVHNSLSRPFISYREKDPVTAAMALRALPSTVSSQILPRIFLPSQAVSQVSSSVSYSIVPISISLGITGGWLSDLWDSVLRAVPKKKTSHMKKRHRQMTGKALKDVKSLSTCSGCGRTKRAHVLCPHCVGGTLYFFGA